MTNREKIEGFIVFEDGGTSSIDYGASEKWFPTYREAKEYADKFIQEHDAKREQGIVDCNSIIIYEASELVLNTSHTVPCGKVWFEWRNY